MKRTLIVVGLGPLIGAVLFFAVDGLNEVITTAPRLIDQIEAWHPHAFEALICLGIGFGLANAFIGEPKR